MTARCLLSMSALIVTLAAPALAEEPLNYCNDPSAEVEWQELLVQNPADYDLQAMHALRIGLCEKVERGDLTVPQATKVFERGRDAIVSQTRLQEAQESRKKGAAI